MGAGGVGEVGASAQFRPGCDRLLRAYRPINDRTYGVLALDKRGGESLRFGAGLVFQVGQ
ncbi:MAG: hypothetical protein COZ06_04360 [Armatimonadetes bacterium CG_4_10_14_3_um_filter_66_18]|nr:MAG: hypothetical protein AUJ96_23475 [Armatimonadetes bacterium CG2_30_66_41]PIU94286.1 MAG: hypothetical protein COS65_08360 [Armatimonadetes bacterium CG06_land_8_20_14_3_00_66_21]PIX47478.1 MAG: hypothetical protein COZ57_08340 [Armatimonadetes bacterium CG_4_8_14_3_um_filter_66_20]PIY51596.1 MAG: hypothetical protein COZ06_04360 [Armatimonadetes bacterium CG_4_10_14_3_um_filter_66_18]PIZ32900.1 MAG: hypothetical protein COY42_30665 [Armatimonadetes bacterium CG_4_10_14_0_8_um_filter_66_